MELLLMFDLALSECIVLCINAIYSFLFLIKWLQKYEMLPILFDYSNDILYICVAFALKTIVHHGK